MVTSHVEFTQRRFGDNVALRSLYPGASQKVGVEARLPQLPKEIQAELRATGLVDLPAEGVRLSYGGRGGFSNQATLLPGFRWDSNNHHVYAVPASRRRPAI